MSETNHYDRRRFIGTAVMATAGAGLLGSRLHEPASREQFSPTATTNAHGSSRPTRIDAGHRKGGYAEAGPSDGPPAILLHGWADSLNSYIDIAPLAANGYRVIVPRGRGKGPSDVVELMDALKIEKALVCGSDDGARTAEVVAALWPQRVKGIAPAGDHIAVSLAANQRPLPPKEELAWWYQYYFASASK